MMTIRQILKHFENRAELGRACGCTKQAAYKWSDDTILAPEYVLSVCRATEWELTPHMVRSDIYPDPAWLPPEARGKGKGARKA
jgi:hypothetical protein